MNDVIIMGSRGYTRSYGGWETLVHGMIDNWSDPNTRFFVTEIAVDDSDREFEMVNGVGCIRVKPKHSGSLQMVEANAMVLHRLKYYLEKYNIHNPIIYVLGPRVGLLFWLMIPFFRRNGITILNNTDGIGTKRGKYNWVQKAYLWSSNYFFDHFVVDYVVADAKEMYRIHKEKLRHRKRPYDMRVIYYGTNEAPKLEGSMPKKVRDYFEEHGIKDDNYYLIINRLVPENSYEMILQEFVKSNTKCDFVVITNQEKEKAFFEKLRSEIPFESDSRVKFVGTVYDKEILAWLRQKARGYINGHTLGGTNPGLLEALATTNVNLIRDCPFSREGADDTGLYFDEAHPLSELISKVDKMPFEDRVQLGIRAKERMRTQFSWARVDEQYVQLFDEISKEKGNKK